MGRDGICTKPQIREKSGYSDLMPLESSGFTPNERGGEKGVCSPIDGKWAPTKGGGRPKGWLRWIVSLPLSDFHTGKICSGLRGGVWTGLFFKGEIAVGTSG